MFLHQLDAVMTMSERDVGRRALLAAAASLGAGALVAGCTTHHDSAGRAQPAADSASTTPSSASAPSPSATPKRPGADITHGPRNVAAVALTFHGAGDPHLVGQLVAAARKAQGQVTVLAVGRWLAGQPDLARQILDAGHELGNHTWTHLTMPRLGATQTREEIDRAATELHRLTGSIGRWFRPSGTPHSTPLIRAAAFEAGYVQCLSYDVDSLDYTDPGPTAVLQNVDRAVRNGSIVSLHLGHPGTIAALPQVFASLRRRGLRCVTVSDLLA